MTRQIVSTGSIPSSCAMRSASPGGAAGPGASRTARGYRGRGDRDKPIPVHPLDRPIAPAEALERAAEMILAAKRRW
jgi:acetolactate synthase-1/2/3 large subunit